MSTDDEVSKEMYVLEQCTRLLGQLQPNSVLRVLLYLARRYNCNFETWYAAAARGELGTTPITDTRAKESA